MTSPTTTPENPAAKTPTPWGELAWDFFLSRILIVCIVGLGLLILRRDPGDPGPRGFLEWLSKWDVQWYMTIIDHGYHYDPSRQSNVVFLPFYPLLVRFFSLNGLFDTKTTGYVVSNAMLFGGAALLWRLAWLETRDRAVALLASRLFLFSPVTFFFSTVYSEATFFFCAAASLLGARTRRWWLAGVAGYCAALTRSVGVLLVVPLLLEYWQQENPHRPPFRPGLWLRALLCLGPGWAALTYVIYCAVAFGDPFAYHHAEVFWGRQLGFFWELFQANRLYNLGPFYRIWFLGTTVLSVVALAGGVVFRLRLSYLSMLLLFPLLYLSSNLLEALPRYMSVVVPVYLVAAIFGERHPSVRDSLLAFSIAFLTLSLLLFSGGYWFT